MYKVKEMARILNISEATIRAWILRKEIKYIKIGKSVRIPQEEIDRLLNGK